MNFKTITDQAILKGIEIIRSEELDSHGQAIVDISRQIAILLKEYKYHCNTYINCRNGKMTSAKLNKLENERENAYSRFYVKLGKLYMNHHRVNNCSNKEAERCKSVLFNKVDRLLNDGSCDDIEVKKPTLINNISSSTNNNSSNTSSYMNVPIVVSSTSSHVINNPSNNNGTHSNGSGSVMLQQATKLKSQPSTKSADHSNIHLHSHQQTSSTHINHQTQNKVSTNLQQSNHNLIQQQQQDRFNEWQAFHTSVYNKSIEMAKEIIAYCIRSGSEVDISEQLASLLLKFKEEMNHFQNYTNNQSIEKDRDTAYGRFYVDVSSIYTYYYSSLAMIPQDQINRNKQNLFSRIEKVLYESMSSNSVGNSNGSGSSNNKSKRKNGNMTTTGYPHQQLHQTHADNAHDNSSSSYHHHTNINASSNHHQNHFFPDSDSLDLLSTREHDANYFLNNYMDSIPFEPAHAMQVMDDGRYYSFQPMSHPYHDYNSANVNGNSSTSTLDHMHKNKKVRSEELSKSDKQNNNGTNNRPSVNTHAHAHAQHHHDVIDHLNNGRNGSKSFHHVNIHPHHQQNILPHSYPSHHHPNMFEIKGYGGGITNGEIDRYYDNQQRGLADEDMDLDTKDMYYHVSNLLGSDVYNQYMDVNITSTKTAHSPSANLNSQHSNTPDDDFILV